MKKITSFISLFLVIVLSGCFNTNINSSIYISSIGFEASEGKLVTYFLSNPLTNISRSENGSDQKSEFIKVETKSVYEAFLIAEQTLLSPLNYKHIKTVIFREEMFKTGFVDEFFAFMKSVLNVSYNYYVFASKDKIEDIYSFKNPEQISYQYSVLSSPNLLKFHEYGTEKMHFLDFVNDYYEKGRYLHVPLIKVNKSWNENTTIEVNGFISVSKTTFIYENSQYPGMLFLYNSDLVLYETEDTMYRIVNYKVNMKEKKGVLTLVISYDDLYIFGIGDEKLLQDKLILDVKFFLDSYIQNENELYLVSEYNYLNKKALDVLDYDVIIAAK